MDKNTFLLKDRIEEINRSFIKDGWITISEKEYSNDNDQARIYCCIISEDKTDEYLTHKSWAFLPGSEGSPTIFGASSNKNHSRYQKYSEEGIEPFLFHKQFIYSAGREEYTDICEDFLNYFKLYEKATDKQNRHYYFIDELGDLIEVLTITPSKIKVKVKFLKEYLAIRRVNLAINFDFMRTSQIDFVTNDISVMDENFSNGRSFYNHLIRLLTFIDIRERQSWIAGKTVIRYDLGNATGYHFDAEEEVFESFITGYDSDGDEQRMDCRKTNEKLFILTYFKKEVLDKYYNDPSKYKVDGFSVRSNFISLKIDNNNETFVAVFLVELATLPHREQLHWKQYNIAPQKGMSYTYHQTMIKGNWVEQPERPDLLFKHIYVKFNRDWYQKFGWKFYKELACEDEHIFTALHIPSTNNVKAFSEQMLSLIKITIDRLNEGEIQKGLELEKGERGITKLEKFLKAKDVEIPDLIIFLRNLYDLRSGLLAHTFSNSNKACKKAMIFFDLKSDNYIEVAANIFIKSIYTIKTLQTLFLEDD